MEQAILAVKNLKKTYMNKKGHRVEAVKGITFDVPRGEIFGFLGPNGAGKSTTISMLTTQLSVTSGEILLDGESIIENPALARSKIGVVAQHNNLDRGLTAEENLLFRARYFGMDKKEAKEKSDYYLKKFGLYERKDDYVKTYSGGMAQRLKIARAMMHTPEILFLDEPTTGLDPNYRAILWEAMQDLNKQGTTIFLTTHYMEEPEQFCHQIAIVNEGEIKAYGTAEELKAMIPSQTIVTLKLSMVTPALLEDLGTLKVKKIKHDGSLDRLYMSERNPNLDAIIKACEKHQAMIKNIGMSQSSLDDVFVYLTGKEQA